MNQNALTTFAAVLPVSPNENCKLVAVTEEKRVAMIERLSRLCAPRFCADRIVGTPETLRLIEILDRHEMGELADFDEQRQSRSDVLHVFAKI